MSFPEKGFGDIDKMPRMKDYLTAEDLNDSGCLELAATVLEEQAIALGHAARKFASWPNKENRAHLKTCVDFYKSDWFKALSCGLADGDAVAAQIIKQATEQMRIHPERRSPFE